MKKESSWLFKIIKHSFLWIFISLSVMLASILLFIFNYRLSIEFTGGIELKINQLQNQEKLVPSLQESLKNQWFDQTQINVEQEGETTDLLIALPFNDDAQVKEVSTNINNLLIDQGFIKNSDDIMWSALNGPSISSYMKSWAINAVIVGLILISIYIMFSFASVRKHISPLSLWGITILSMLFSITVSMGMFALWMMFDTTVTVDTVFVISILTVMWYSINDTIIIMDRIRENLTRHNEDLKKGTMLYGQLIEDSIWQTMRRSLGTGITVLLVALTMFVFGTDMLQKFAFIIAAGIVAGTFSSLFLASPLTYIVLGKRKKELKKL